MIFKRSIKLNKNLTKNFKPNHMNPNINLDGMNTNYPAPPDYNAPPPPIALPKHMQGMIQVKKDYKDFSLED